MTVYDSIKKIAMQVFKSERIYSEVCTVVSVSGRVAVCDPIDDTARLQKVRLQALGAQSLGFVLVPKVGSYVAVSFLDNKNGFITSTVELEEILIDTDLVTFNGGSNGELMNINDFTTKINGLKTEVQAELALISAAIAGVGGAYTPGALTAFNKNDYKDIKILH